MGGGFYRYLIILNYLHCCLEFNCWSCRMSIRTIPEDWSLVERCLTHLRWWVTTINGNLNIGVERYCLTFVIFPKTTISAYFDVIWQPASTVPLIYLLQKTSNIMSLFRAYHSVFCLILVTSWWCAQWACRRKCNWHSWCTLQTSITRVSLDNSNIT